MCVMFLNGASVMVTPSELSCVLVQLCCYRSRNILQMTRRNKRCQEAPTILSFTANTSRSFCMQTCLQRCHTCARIPSVGCALAHSSKAHQCLRRHMITCGHFPSRSWEVKLGLFGPGGTNGTAVTAETAPVDGDWLREQFQQLWDVTHNRELLAKRLRQCLSGQFPS